MKYALIQHSTKRATVYTRKMDAEYAHVTFKRGHKVQFKEIRSLDVLPSNYTIIEK